MSNKIKIGLISVVKTGDYLYEQEIHLGLAAIGSFLREKGYEVEFKQCLPDKGEDELDRASELEADVYGFQLNIVNYWQVHSIVKKIKARKPNAVTVFGGPFLASLSEKILKNESMFDFIIVGDGEFTLLELLHKLESEENNFSEISGLVWKNESGAVVINEKRRVVENLDIFPFPARDFLEEAMQNGKLTESLRISTSRGCVASCNFCCVNLYNRVQKGRSWRGRSPKHVVDELEYLSKTYGARVFNFADSSFEDPGEPGKARAAEICQEIIRRKLPLSAKIYMRCETMKTEKDIELLRLYKKAGIDVIIPGVEVGSDDELKLYGKKATFEDNLRTIRILKELDLFYILPGFIMFGPYSTLKTIKTNIEFLGGLELTDNIMLLGNVLMLLRDSKIYQMLMTEGRLLEKPERFWELPKYVFLDPKAEILSKHWQYGRIFSRFPDALKVNNLQINIGNLVSRMTNPMNANIFDVLADDFEMFKRKYSQVKSRFSKIQYEYFVKIINFVERDCSDSELKVAANDFFGNTYSRFLPEYFNLYNGFLEKVVKNNFSLSGLIFNAFHSAMAENDSEEFSIK